MVNNIKNIPQKNFTGCKIIGFGKLIIPGESKSEKFNILEISDTTIKIESDLKLELESIIDLKVYLDGLLFQFIIKTQGKVISRIGSGYEVQFLNLSENDKNELTEVIKNTCHNSID